MVWSGHLTKLSKHTTTMSKPVTITIDELAEILRLATAKLADEELVAFGGKYAVESQSKPSGLRELLAKLRAMLPTHYLGTVNAGSMLSYEAMESGYPLQKAWDTIVNEFDLVGPDKESTQGALAVGDIRGFLSRAGLIKTDK